MSGPDPQGGRPAEGPLFAGVDVGTSGVRVAVIDAADALVAFAAAPMPQPVRDAKGGVRQDPAIWFATFDAAFDALPGSLTRGAVAAIAVAGTSGTIVGVNAHGEPVAPARMYNEATARDEALMIAAVAPAETAAHGVTSPLGRAIRLMNDEIGLVRVLHQADLLAARLHGRFDLTDENNALKTGYDPVQRRWPDWIGAAGMPRSLLPGVVPAGQPVGPLTAEAAARHGLDPACLVVAGTTDGCASFLATGAGAIGDGVTALGSTLVVKLLAAAPLFASEYGVYSHRIGDDWLVGGASNAGGAAIAQVFDADRIAALSATIDPEGETGLDLYPLVSPGERFPVADPDLQPRMGPRPADDALYLKALFEALARIEAEAYARLAALGAPALRSIRSVGGGARDPALSRMRAARLGVPFLAAGSEEAAVGAARLARRGALSQGR
jgi:sugar (pentulose or hexulose) kinase